MKWRVVACMCLAACSAPPDRLVPDSAIVGDAIPIALTSTVPDARRGAEIFVARDGGHCVLCHGIDGLAAPFQGNVGPDLSAVGARLSPGQIRLRIVDYDRVTPGTLMPSYYRTHGLNQVGEPYQDAPVLSAGDIEDVIAYLGQQTGE